MRLSIVTIIANAVRLDYPIVPMLESVASVADELIVNVDTGRDDGTVGLVTEALERLSEGNTKFSARLLPEVWDWDNHEKGSELAKQTNIAFEACRGDFILYVQADEAIHENHYGAIRGIVEHPIEGVVAYTLNRLYFWGNPHTIRADWTFPLQRLFKRGSRISIGDAMNTAGAGDTFRTNIALYHYSRLGDPSLIARRIANLDSLFHAQATITAPDTYQFPVRDFDTYSAEDIPKLVAGKFIRYVGMHPKSFEEFYRARGTWNSG